MIFNFTRDYQFSTRLLINGTLLETLDEMKLLGTLITSDLTWSANTESLVKGFQRMIILHKLYEFNVPDSEMVNIYNLFIRSVLEQSCALWHYNLSEEDIVDLERVQKVACKVILKDRYIDYSHASEYLNLENLRSRREKLCLKFAKKCLKFEKNRGMFPLNTNLGQDTLRNQEKYEVQFASTSRLLKSSIPQMQRALNADEK